MLERFEEFTFAIYEIQKLWNKIASEVMESFGLKGSYVVYLLAISNSSEGITAAQIGSICGRDKADISRAIAALESKGLITRENQGGIYRAKLSLTEQGRLLTDKIKKKAAYAENMAGQGLTDGDREALYRSLNTIRANLRELASAGFTDETEETEDEEEMAGLMAVPFN